MKTQKFYESMYRENQPVPESRLERLLVHLQRSREEAAFRLLDNSGVFLDIGCGEGTLVFMASQRYKEAHGIDIAETRISRAQKKATELEIPEVFFQAADVCEGIPFSAQYFDAVCVIATLELIFNPIQLLEEVNRVLKPDGQLVVTASNIGYLPRRINALLGKPPKTSAAPGIMDGGTLHYFTLGLLSDLLNQQGFKIVCKSNIGSLWFLRNVWKSLFASGLIIKAVKTG